MEVFFLPLELKAHLGGRAVTVEYEAEASLARQASGVAGKF